MIRKLHIGGLVRASSWEVMNEVPGEHVDHLGDAKDLSQFNENTFSEIYASHVLEHFDYNKELLSVLIEWKRVMIPGGKIYLSVPDMNILAHLFLQQDTLTGEDRFFVMRMMFGGHVDEYDYHHVGLNEEFLYSYLYYAGFVNIRRVKEFGIFDDTSNMLFKGVPISLNMIAEKPMGNVVDDSQMVFDYRIKD